MIREDDITELGFRTAAWLAVAADDPAFMLAGLALRERLSIDPRP
jgi:hypothetical protein